MAGCVFDARTPTAPSKPLLTLRACTARQNLDTPPPLVFVLTAGGGSASSAGPPPVRESERRRTSTTKASYSYSYASGSEEEEEAEERSRKEEDGEQVRDGAEGPSYSGTGGATTAAGAAANGSAAGARPNGAAAAAAAGVISESGAPGSGGGGGGGGSSTAAGERAISDVVRAMLEHQGDVLTRHGKLDMIVRLARESWQEPPPPVEANLPAVAEHLLGFLGAIDEYGWFAAPVSETDAPGYIAAILRPMDLGTMRSRAERRGYRSVSELQDDLLLVVANCLSYNSPDTMFSEAATALAMQASGAYGQALAAASASNGWGLRNDGPPAAAGAAGAGPAPVVGKRKRGRPRKNRG